MASKTGWRQKASGEYGELATPNAESLAATFGCGTPVFGVATRAIRPPGYHPAPNFMKAKKSKRGTVWEGNIGHLCQPNQA